MSGVNTCQNLAEVDPAMHALVGREAARQEHHLELIASENYTSRAVMEAVGSGLTNKYAEGYPGRRYYGGCAVVDEVEQLAQQRLRALFGAESVNVQPHSGAQANLAVLYALLQPGDRILGMNLAAGGHLTHGMPLNLSGKWFDAHAYGVDALGEIDYAEVERLAQTLRPKLLIAGASSYCLRIDFERFARIAREAGALLMVDMAHYAGLIAAGLYPNPIPHADVVTSTTHKGLRGPRGGVILMKERWEQRINSAIFPGTQGGPLMHVIAGKAVAFHEALQPSFRDYQQRVLDCAHAMAAELLARGIRLVGGRTDCHMVLLDLRGHALSGAEAERLLESVGLTCNKNAVPDDPRKPGVTSGIRLGTPAMATRGMGPDEARQVAAWVADVLQAPGDTPHLAAIGTAVRHLCDRFPVYS